MKKLLEKGVYIISGAVEFAIIKGEVISIGKKILVGEKIFVPEGKRIPLEINSESEIEFNKEVELQNLSSRTIPNDWDKVVEKIISNKINSLLVFGEVDTGKTFFSTYLTNRLNEKNIKVSVLDCDTGQSDIGPPGTLGLASYTNGILFMADSIPEKMYFVGSHSPAEHFLHYISGFTKLVNYGLKNSDVVIIDTPGWVHGDGGRMLRRTEIEILAALTTNFCVVLLQRHNELEHLVKCLKESQIIRLTVSKKASPTSTEERKKLREFVYKKYFSGSKKIELDFGKIFTDRSYFLSGEKTDSCPLLKNNILWSEKLSNWEGMFVVSQKELSKTEHEKIKKYYNVTKIRNVVPSEFCNVVVGLLDDKMELLGLGIIEEINFKKQKIYISTPEKDLINKIRGIQFGSLRTKSSGDEAGFIEPGIL